MGRTKIEGFSKYEVARKVVALVFDRGWTPVSKITPMESYMHNGSLKYVCIMEKEGEDISDGYNFKKRPK